MSGALYECVSLGSFDVLQLSFALHSLESDTPRTLSVRNTGRLLHRFDCLPLVGYLHGEAAAQQLYDNYTTTYTTTIRQLYDNLYDNSKNSILHLQNVYFTRAALLKGERFWTQAMSFWSLGAKPMENAVVVKVVV